MNMYRKPSYEIHGVGRPSVDRTPTGLPVEWVVLAALVLIGIACRFWIETPNFQPIAAFALFGGFYFRQTRWAIFAVLCMLACSDFRLGYYPWQLMLCVYASLSLSVVMGVAIRTRLGQSKFGIHQGCQFLIASLLMSTGFFVVTNAAVWWMGWYPPTFTGLMESYLAALPFYRWTIAGDLFFTGLTVSSYLAASWAFGWQPAARSAVTVRSASSHA